MNKAVIVAGRFAIGIALPTALYYVLRAMGLSVFVSLLVPALVSAVPGLVSLLRRKPTNGLSTYFTAMMLGALLVSLIPGNNRFLLARDAVLTAVTGVWFIASARGGLPLTYLFTRPLVEGRMRWPSDWATLWNACPRFRRMWRVSSVMWGVGLLVDAAVRVVSAYTLPPDSVPALMTALYVVTLVVMNIVTNVYYANCGVRDPRSRMYEPVRSSTAA